MIWRILPLLVVLLLASCVPMAPKPEPIDISVQPVSFLEDVKPVLDSRCAVCHSCYNAACQLKLTSYEGLSRGASQIPVYATRLKAQEPTRLFIDAQTTEQWRDKGFFPVAGSDEPSTGRENRDGQITTNDSTMAYFLDAKRRLPVPSGEYQAETDLTCAADQKDVRKFLGKHPERGMPFGFPALTQAEDALLNTWLAQGAPGPTPAQQARLTAPSAAAAEDIVRWETFLNQDDAKHAMTARYLYEHFFLAHLKLGAADDNEFFELVRSTTPPGQPIAIVATVRPYDDPGPGPIYYRFRKIHSTIVYKTHIVVELNDERLARYQELFINTPWLQTPHIVATGDFKGANPFLIYAQIPPDVRYQFLLDHSEYIIRTFTRGPVCKGQIAVDVIQDHFWVLFLDPQADQVVQHPEFLLQQAHNLALPDEKGSNEAARDTFSDEFRDRYFNYYVEKNALYDRVAPQGFAMNSVWRGNGPIDTPMLTVYRHFDSANVVRGAVGDLPRTMWVIDYPQFERIYYALVAGFDVFGDISHQANVRRYMDYLRVEGELNFSNFMPANDRYTMLSSWYIGVDAAAHVKLEEVITSRPSRVIFTTDDPKREFVEAVISDHLNPAAGVSLDPINYHPAGTFGQLPVSYQSRQDLIDGFHALNAPGTGFIRHVTDSDVNVIYLRIRGVESEDRFFSIVINRWHDNVNSMFGDNKRLDPSKDTIDFIDGSISAYPNLFFDVSYEELSGFFDMLENYDGTTEYLARYRKYSVNRADPDFWALYDWFQQQLNEADPVQAGLYDLNRYYHQVEIQAD
jgi:hypothetical protein